MPQQAHHPKQDLGGLSRSTPLPRCRKRLLHPLADDPGEGRSETVVVDEGKGVLICGPGEVSCLGGLGGEGERERTLPSETREHVRRANQHVLPPCFLRLLKPNHQLLNKPAPLALSILHRRLRLDPQALHHLVRVGRLDYRANDRRLNRRESSFGAGLVVCRSEPVRRRSGGLDEREEVLECRRSGVRQGRVESREGEEEFASLEVDEETFELGGADGEELDVRVEKVGGGFAGEMERAGRWWRGGGGGEDGEEGG